MPARLPQTHRREILKGAATLGMAAALSRLPRLSAADSAQAKPGAKRYNVLFMMSDDMRPELDCYGNALVHAPNLSALAQAGVRFDRGYCQFPLCCPSRSSMLTGRHVLNTGVYGNRTWFGDTRPELVSLPKYFKQNGYITMHAGKIFHGGIDDTAAWTVGGEARFLAGTDDAAEIDIPRPAANAGIFGQAATGPVDGAQTGKASTSDRFIVVQGNGENQGDYHAADRAIQFLRDYQGQYGDQPFFIAYGAVKPHSPPTAPQKFYDAIPLDKIQLPVDFSASRKLPEGFPEGCLRPRNADLFIGRDASVEEAKEMTRAYLASISWVDFNIGRVVAELDRLGLRENTIICFSADHGYQLGEKGKWSKAGSLWEEGARIPMFIAAPNAKGNGQVCKRIVETLNFYPTLVELCGLPMPAGQEGRSMTALLDNPRAKWDYPAYTVWSENGTSGNPPPNPTLTGIGVRIEGWRYAEFDLGGAMLLDMEKDPHQLKNLAHDPKYADIVAKMSDLIKQYKAKALPATTTKASA